MKNTQVNKGEETRHLLIQTAIELFAKRGIHGVSLRSVGQAAAQKNTAAVHYYFGDRDTLLDAALDKILDGIRVPPDKGILEELKSGLRLKAGLRLKEVVIETFLPVLTLPERYPEWGFFAIKLILRIITGDAEEIASRFKDKVDLDTRQAIEQFKMVLPKVSSKVLESRLDLAFLFVVAAIASSDFEQQTTSHKDRKSNRNEVIELLDFVVAGISMNQ